MREENRKKFNVGSFFGSAIEGGIVAGVSAIPGVGTVAVGLSAGVGGGINSVLKQYGESGEIDIGQVQKMRWLVVLLVGLHINLPVYEMLRQEKHRLLRKYLQMQRQEMQRKKSIR